MEFHLVNKYFALVAFILFISPQILFSAPIDFDGDGFTNVSTYSVRNKNARTREVAFRWLSSDGQVKTASVDGQYPVVGEYLGTTKSQLATLSIKRRSVYWNIRGMNSSAIQFGRVGDVFISGCRFASPQKTSLSYLRGNILTYTEVGRDTPMRVRLRINSLSEVLGCGDLSNDGIDELLFRLPGGKDKPDLIVGYETDGSRKLIKRTQKFIRFFSVKRPDGIFDPLIAISREISSQYRILKIEPLLEPQYFPTLETTMRADITNGFFLDASEEVSSGVLYKESSGNEVFMRILEVDGSDTAVFVARESEKLVKAVAIYRPS